jgi:hypothetical protein
VRSRRWGLGILDFGLGILDWGLMVGAQADTWPAFLLLHHPLITSLVGQALA